MKKVVIVGPESTGKTTLAAALAAYYQTAWVHEYARSFLSNLKRAYKEDDLLEIAKGQLLEEEKQHEKANRLLICDTDLRVIKIWSYDKFGSCHPWIIQQIAQRHYDLYLLSYIDVAWEPDPQREDPHRRDFFYDTYLQELASGSTPFVVVKGELSQRKKTAVEAINKILI